MANIINETLRDFVKNTETSKNAGMFFNYFSKVFHLKSYEECFQFYCKPVFLGVLEKF